MLPPLASSIRIPRPPLTVMGHLRLGPIRRALRMIKPRSILEIGAGEGAAGMILAQHALYIGIEPDKRSASTAVKRLALFEHAEIRIGGIECLQEDEIFDMVCAFEVIEHLEDDVGVVQTWVEHLHENGHLLISTPAHSRRFNVSDAAVGHFRRYDASDLDQLIEDAGLEIVCRISYGAFGGHFLEMCRNQVVKRYKNYSRSGMSTEERTASSGRLFQPKTRLAGCLAHLGSIPFRLLQRPFFNSEFGVGWVVIARKTQHLRAH